MKDEAGRRKRVAMLTPLPPSKSGVAHYASILLPELRKRVDVDAFASLERYDRSNYDAVVYQLGNNPHHEEMYREALREPGVVVLHDLVLHHLIVELTLARGDAEAYVAALEANHGGAGGAWARGRAAGLHSEIGNFLLPASVEIANRSRAVIVHNRYAAERLVSFGVTTPIHVVPHPWVADERPADRERVRTAHGITADQRVIGFFGFVTSAKRAEVVLEAFRLASARDPRLVLLVVGEPAPNIDVEALHGDGVVMTGYVADEEFGAYYAAADRLVNLRYPSAGETSGTLIRAFAAGKPVAVSEYAQFAEFPESCAVRIPFGEREAETLSDFFLRELDEKAIARAQRAWLEEHARMDLTVEGYLRAIEATDDRTVPAERRSTIALFPQLELLRATVSDGVCAIEVRNRGDASLCGRSYSEPAYRIVAKVVEGGKVVQDRWLELGGDVEPGASATVTFTLLGAPPRFELQLFHALQEIPMLDPTPWATVEVGSV